MQDLVFDLIEFHKAPVGPFLQPVFVPRDGDPALKHISASLLPPLPTILVSFANMTSALCHLLIDKDVR